MQQSLSLLEGERMSAWVVSQRHIDALLTAAINSPYGVEFPGPTRERVTTENADQCGRALWAECIRSVSHRYPGERPDALPGPSGGGELESYRFRPCPLPAVVVLKAIRCYEYQSCEHPEWEASPACEFCADLRLAWIPQLPGYDEAPWGIA
jgi:hypothetical protein